MTFEQHGFELHGAIYTQIFFFFFFLFIYFSAVQHGDQEIFFNKCSWAVISTSFFASADSINRGSNFHSRLVESMNVEPQMQRADFTVPFSVRDLHIHRFGCPWRFLEPIP